MAQSAPHIYLSALPFAPSSSIIAEVYSPRFPFTLNVSHGRLKQWPALVTTIFVPDKPEVTCIAWSRNDEAIATGMTDGSVSVWDSTTGTTVKRPFKAGSRWGNVIVSSIAFSPDGLYLVSGLSYGRIRIWDLMTELETAVGGQKRAFERHSGAISALSFSLDGKQLIQARRTTQFGSGTWRKERR